MTKPDLMPLAQEERTDLLTLLRGLSQAQWQAQSLCRGWRVQDVATHVVSYEELSKPALAWAFIRGRGNVATVNDVALRRYHSLDTDGVMNLLADNLRPSGLTSGFRGAIALTDGTIHHQDIRRALGRGRTIPADRLAAALDFAVVAPTLPARKNSRGLRLTATDIDWSFGAGHAVTGPGEALLMALAGRPQALDDLAGPGLDVLRARLR